MKLLFLANWKIKKVFEDRDDIQQPDKIVHNNKYWFFRFWPIQDIKVDVIDYSKFPIFHNIEKKLLRIYVIQALKVFPKIKKYDLIISHGAQSGFLLAFIRSVFGFKNPPHIIIDVGCLNGGRSRQPELLLFQFAMKSVKGLIYHASSQKKHYDRYFSSLSQRSFFVPFGVDIEFFKPLDVRQEDYILSIGYKFRDWFTLINAFSRINTKTSLKIVGPKDLNIGLSDKVHVQPYVPIDILKELIAKAKFIVLPLVDLPYAHGQMTLLQSMSMGKAVIVTKVPSIIDYVSNGEDALFVKLKDIVDMRNKIEYLMNNPDEIIRLGKNARETVENKFTEKNMAESIYKACKSLNII